MLDLNINGNPHTVNVPNDMPLLWVLRDVIGLTGTQFGCDIAQCGACTVHLDGQPVRSCVLPEEVWTNTKEATAFRQSVSRLGDFGPIAAWLRRGEIEGRELDCAQFNSTRFKDCLKNIRKRTNEDINQACKLMIEECASAGVAVVLVPELPRLRVCGATRWLSSDRALIQLSLFYKRDDHFWFSFFHEAGHILLHGKREIFVEQSKTIKEKGEEEANQFASDYLIPPNEYAMFCSNGDFSKASIIDFANEIDISPSIVASRLQHDKFVGFNERNDLHVRLDWPAPDHKKHA